MTSAIFCDSEFFHGYQWNKIRQKVAAGTHGDFWVKKIESNMARDELIDKQLYALGWVVLHFWGEEIKKESAATISDCVLWSTDRQIRSS